MIIHKVLNNNAVSCIDPYGNEIILKGSGLAFHKSAGDTIDDTKIQKKFILENNEVSRKYQEIMVAIPSDCIETSEEVIEMIKENIDKKLSDSIYITLTDHISSLLERVKFGISLDNTLLWDIKRMYKDEYKLGLQAVEIIRENLDIKLEDNEACFIALHIVNAQMDVELKDVYLITKLIDEVYSLLEKEFTLEIDKDELIYTRFVLHLRFFFERILHHTVVNKSKNSDLLDIMKSKYHKQYEFVEKICMRVQRKFKHTVSADEKLYLLIHVVKLTMDNL